MYLEVQLDLDRGFWAGSADLFALNPVCSDLQLLLL